MSTFRISYFLHSDSWQFGNQFFIVTTHGALDAFVILQTL